jgi:tetratricopeptide (TPR) repeat protein
VELVPFGTLRWGLIGSLLSDNRPREALRSIEGIHSWFVELGARWTVHWQRYTGILHQLGEHERELEVAREARTHISGPLYGMAYEGRALAALGRLDELRALVGEIVLAAPQPTMTPGQALETLAEEARAHGHGSAASEIVDRALDWYDEQLEEFRAGAAGRMLRGQLLYLRADWDEAAAVFAALPADSVEIVDVLGYQGAIAARRGDIASARRLVRDLAELQLPRLNGTNTYWRACIAALLGDKDEAVALIQRAFNEGLGYGIWIHRDIDFESLREYPPFQELMRPKG